MQQPTMPIHHVCHTLEMCTFTPFSPGYKCQRNILHVLRKVGVQNLRLFYLLHFLVASLYTDCIILVRYLLTVVKHRFDEKLFIYCIQYSAGKRYVHVWGKKQRMRIKLSTVLDRMRLLGVEQTVEIVFWANTLLRELYIYRFQGEFFRLCLLSTEIDKYLEFLKI